MNSAEQHVRVRDIDIAYRTVGSGPQVLIVHGGPGIGHAYLRPLDAWADEFEVVYYDQRGSGGSPVGDVNEVSFGGGIADLDALRRALGIERVSLVGHSFGAILALLYASQHPESTRSLVLLNAAPPFIPEMQPEFGATMAGRRTADDNSAKASIEASSGFAARDPETLERYFLNSYAPFFDDRANTARASLGFTDITAANVLECPERTFRDLGSLDPVGAMANVTCPTLVLHSQHDPVPQAFSRLLADKIAGAEHVLLQGVNHFVHLEAPDVLAAAVAPFLRAHTT
jgi:proline iminopeptidase